MTREEQAKKNANILITWARLSYGEDWPKMEKQVASYLDALWHTDEGWPPGTIATDFIATCDLVYQTVIITGEPTMDGPQ